MFLHQRYRSNATAVVDQSYTLTILREIHRWFLVRFDTRALILADKPALRNASSEH